MHIKTPVGSQYPYPGIRIPVKDELKDFTWADTVELDIYNDSNEPKDIFIKFFDKNGATSDHRLSAIIAGSNHLSFNVTGLNIDRANIASILFYTSPGIQELNLYFSDLHLLGVDKEAMKQHELPFSEVVPYVDGKLNEQMWRSSTKLAYKSGVTDNEAAVSSIMTISIYMLRQSLKISRWSIPAQPIRGMTTP